MIIDTNLQRVLNGRNNRWNKHRNRRKHPNGRRAKNLAIPIYNECVHGKPIHPQKANGNSQPLSPTSQRYSRCGVLRLAFSALFPNPALSAFLYRLSLR